ncbi:SRPBCC family protein [uncultured Tateyamaria sp.]|uniref:SRPBCC family protein n=1 Tax=uncultured Tateyamaria sp. TaxID=455651 RepID=UPI002626ADB9|nr:SRPBCC family protein [uncultured Tateyamaria sp.]
MKYVLSGHCNCPPEDFLRFMFDPQHMLKWQKSLISHEVVGGEVPQQGARSAMTHRYGKRVINMTETVEVSDLPNGLTAVYEAPSAWNRVRYEFSRDRSGGTEWRLESEFRCTGVLRIMTILMPGMFRRTTAKEMEALKAYAEAHRGGLPHD